MQATLNQDQKGRSHSILIKFRQQWVTLISYQLIMNSILLCIFRCLRDNWSYIGGYLKKKTSQHAISWFFPLAQLGLVSPKFLVGFSIKARAENREWSEQIFGGSFRNERPLFFQLPGLVTTSITAFPQSWV